MKIVLASHSNLAEGMKNTVELIMGKQTDLHTISAYLDDSVDFYEQLTNEIQTFKNEPILFFTDIMGGSINNIISEFIKDKDNYYLLSGLNLPVLMELLVTDFTSGREHVIKQINKAVLTGVSGIKLNVFDDIDLEEDDF